METRIDSSEHARAAHRSVSDGIVPEYVTTSEIAMYLRWSTRTVRQKVRAGMFRLNEHFFRPPGCQTRWKLSAIADWLEGKRTST